MAQTTKELRILIIDDNLAIHGDFIKILTSNSSGEAALAMFEKQVFDKESVTRSSLPEFEINTASQGQEGIDKIKVAITEKNPYALAFVDIRMPPGMDGIETTKEIWRLDPDIQIVICTAYSDYSWEETIEQLGQRENLLILKKPFDSVAVRQLSCALTKKWQLLQEARDYTQSLEDRVSERTKSLQESLSVTRGTLESSTDGILVVSNENLIIDYNHNLENMFHIPQSLLDRKDANLLLEYISEQVQQPENFLMMTKDVSSQSDIVRIDQLKCKDGRIFEHCTQPYKLNDKVSGRIWSFRDITARAMLEEQLQYQATHDSLTKLPNRVLLTDRLHQAIAHAKRTKAIFYLLFFDLDRFKLINDSFSHYTGDQLLQEVAKRLKLLIRDEDTLARLGGDEFVAILRTYDEQENAATIAGRLLEIFKTPFHINKHELLVSPSIGIASFPQDGQDVDALLRNADTAMYRAKEYGGNQYQFYTPSLGKQSLERLELEEDLRKAIAREEFFLCYQPQFDLNTQQLVSAEALIRWNHPIKGLVLPINFIPMAEETGLIVPIGEWVLRTACQQNKQWQDAGLPKIRIAINIATKQLKFPNLAEVIRNILHETGLDPQYLELEVTENVMITSIDASATIRELKDMGVHFALDDFGSGYSSLNHLRIFPLDRLKIDQSFINNIDINHGDEVIIKAIIAMAKNLNLDVVAEGVESKAQLDFLKSNDCSEVQGFYFSKPLENVDFEKFLKNPDFTKYKNLFPNDGTES